MSGRQLRKVHSTPATKHAIRTANSMTAPPVQLSEMSAALASHSSDCDEQWRCGTLFIVSRSAPAARTVRDRRVVSPRKHHALMQAHVTHSRAHTPGRLQRRDATAATCLLLPPTSQLTAVLLPSAARAGTRGGWHRQGPVQAVMRGLRV